MGRWQLFWSGFRTGWRDATPEERSKAASTGAMLGIGAALLAVVFILSN